MMGVASPPIKLALTLGDPAGIGGEIVLKALARIVLRQKQLSRRLYSALRSQKLILGIVGSRLFLEHQLKLFSIKEQNKTFPLEKFFQFSTPQTLSVLNPVENNATFAVELYLEDSKSSTTWNKKSWNALKPGLPSRTSGKLALKWLQRGCKLIEKKVADALVTAPLSKAIVSLSNPNFVGHTEYLETYFDSTTPKKAPLKVSMGFVSPDFNLTLMTRHIALQDVSRHLTLETIERTLHHAGILAFLTQRSSDSKPSIPLAVLALNPHGGENGLFGTEEKRILKAIKKCEEYFHQTSSSVYFKNLSLEGPLSADTAFFQVGRNKRYQQVIACYHDQGLIPLKTHAGFMAANVTLGLPFIRTSVDHGTAFDIAGKDLADETSFIYALYQAWKLQEKYQIFLKSLKY